jgi:hypothetical protein
MQFDTEDVAARRLAMAQLRQLQSDEAAILHLVTLECM